MTHPASGDQAMKRIRLSEAIRESRRKNGLLPDGWTLVEMALAYPPETPTEPSQSIPAARLDEGSATPDQKR